MLDGHMLLRLLCLTRSNVKIALVIGLNYAMAYIQLSLLNLALICHCLWYGLRIFT